MGLKNDERFTNKADIYRKYRPAYPKELIDYLYMHVGFTSESIVADIGSGTGIFSLLLLKRGSKVYCVEPNEDMRQTAEKDLSTYKNFVSISGNDENTGLQANSVDFVTAAQAFHWFNQQAFTSECRRILRFNGKVLLAWNIRDYEHEIIKRDYKIREEYCIDRKGLGEGGGPSKDCESLFKDSICECKIFRNDLIIDRETYIGMNLSRSYAPNEENYPDKFHGFLNELGKLFDEYSVNGFLSYPHFTKSYVGRI